MSLKWMCDCGREVATAGTECGWCQNIRAAEIRGAAWALEKIALWESGRLAGTEDAMATSIVDERRKELKP